MEVVYYVACSLDGFIAGPDGDVSFLNRYLASGEDYGYTEFYGGIDAIVMGSRTYEFALKHAPPDQTADRRTIVFTNREFPATDAQTSLVQSSPAECLVSLEGEGYHRVWLMGGGRLAGAFLADHLIDRLELAITPDLLGQGVPLFGGAAASEPLRLLEHRVHPSGLIQASYAIKSGSKNTNA